MGNDRRDRSPLSENLTANGVAASIDRCPDITSHYLSPSLRKVQKEGTEGGI